jgi:hypothetical protein
MKILLFVLIAYLFPLVAGANEETCPITLAEYMPVAATGALPVNSNSSHAWYGGEALAALIPKNGIWTGMGPEKDFGDKFWWWRLGYDAKVEPVPDLEITARRLDGSAASIRVSNATSGYSSNRNVIWNSMLVGMEFPTSGCWEVTGTYNAVETLILVFQVGQR